MALRLFYAPGACSFAALAALEEAGAAYEPTKLVLASGEQKKPEFLAINPRGRVPALVVESGVITENIAVLTYIAERFPAAGLLPKDDAALLGRAYELMSWFASGVHVSIAQIWRSERYTRDEDGKKLVQQGGRENILNAFKELDAAFKGPWILGDRFSLVDPYAYVFWRWGLRLELDMAGYKSWAAHTERLLKRPAIERALAVEAR